MGISFNTRFVSTAQKALCAAFALSIGVAAAAPAQATSFAFDFVNLNSGSGANKQTSTVANNKVDTGTTYATATVTKTVNNNSLAVQLSAWSIDTVPNPDKTYDAVMSFWSGGIGVLNDYEASNTRGESSQSPDHAIDNDNGNVDFLVLQFSKPVNLSSINLGWINNDSDATIRWGDAPGVWNILPVLNNVNVNAASGLNSMVNTGITYTGDTTTGSRTTAASGAMSDFWVISAANPDVNDGTNRSPLYKNDFFKLAAIVVSDFPPLPEPGTWMTMILGFGAIGATMRRRKVVVNADKLARA